MNKFERKNGAANFNANIGIGPTIPHNDFDGNKVIDKKVYPWSEMEEVVDMNGDKWIRVPKFYTKYQIAVDGSVEGRYASQYKVAEDWKLNPIFIRDGKELPYIEISKYLIDIDNSTEPAMARTRKNVIPVRGLVPAKAREYVRNCGIKDITKEYSLMDIWTLQLIQDLFAIEYATTECQAVMKGYVYSNYSVTGLLRNGLTDPAEKDTKALIETVDYHTGCRTLAEAENGLGPMKYRGLENIWGNGQTYIDGIYSGDANIYICKEVNNYGNLENYIPTNTRKLEEHGNIWQLALDAENHLCLPRSVDPTGWYRNIYTGADSIENCAVYNGASDDNCGLWTYSMGVSINSYIPNSTFRMVRRPL